MVNIYLASKKSFCSLLLQLLHFTINDSNLKASNRMQAALFYSEIISK